MVRFKSRYLYFDVEYSPPDSRPIRAAEDEDLLPGGGRANDSVGKRYLQLHGQPSPSHYINESQAVINANAILKAVQSSIKFTYGDTGLGLIKSSLQVKYFSNATSSGVIRVSRDQYRKVWSAITMIRELCGVGCAISVRHASGTIKKAQKKIVIDNSTKANLLLK
ncbi:ribonuclease P/MRP protein subunit [Dipodascopsis tothii]|uniref:ribonuclease P/MRP protein subunit n=1 Tax=Dipodascopsis tothii TaxID=44089 RepID=UPI0034D005D2